MTRTALDFLGGESIGEGEWRFDLGRELHGAFGGAFGGVLAAVAVLSGQEQARGRTTSGLDCRFLRGLPAGPARVRTQLVAHGRSLTCVSVHIVGSDDRLATQATVSYTNPDALEPFDHGASPSRCQPEVKPHAEGKPWKEPRGVEIPILETFDPRGVGRSDLGIATSVTVPWDDASAAAASACLAADMCVGPPVDLALTDGWIPHPNPDLSLRFTGAPDAPTMTGHGRLEAITGGLATVRVEVWGAGNLAAVGAASSLLLRRPSTENEAANQ